MPTDAEDCVQRTLQSKSPMSPIGTYMSQLIVMDLIADGFCLMHQSVCGGCVIDNMGGTTTTRRCT